MASCISLFVWIAIFDTNLFWCALQRVLGPSGGFWISLDTNQVLSTGLRMSLLIKSGSLENYSAIGLKVVSIMFVLELAKPRDYSKKGKKITLTQLQDDKALYLTNNLFGLNWVYFSWQYLLLDFYWGLVHAYELCQQWLRALKKITKTTVKKYPGTTLGKLRLRNGGWKVLLPLLLTLFKHRYMYRKGPFGRCQLYLHLNDLIVDR